MYLLGCRQEATYHLNGMCALQSPNVPWPALMRLRMGGSEAGERIDGRGGRACGGLSSSSAQLGACGASQFAQRANFKNGQLKID
ncbi:unnamed protein product [Protopolystoma xenopodis]|uniref:Uncharacterized protein n=1 Tax=Protopolystoma xenopodis TaxID=117903 RepID=A0A3S5CUW3_9PLAT|nr:unnamed protein product [Protopolystoma xenopodis]